MRHYKKGRKLGTDASHTKAIKKNLVVNLLKNDRVKTTLERAKEIRGDVDRVITWAKRGDVHSRRLAIAKIGDKDLVAELFSKVAQGMFEGRPGGYTRILRLGTRRGDGATIVIMELVAEPLVKKDSTKGATAVKGAAAKSDAKADAKGAAAAKGDAKSAKAAAKKSKKAAKAEAAEEAEEVVEETGETGEEAGAEATGEEAAVAAEAVEVEEAVEEAEGAEAVESAEPAEAAEPEAAEAEAEAEPEPAAAEPEPAAAEPKPAEDAQAE
jgi:large subunit ribosomal protein L17